MGEASLYGAMKYEKTGGRKTIHTPAVAWPRSVKCVDQRSPQEKAATARKTGPRNQKKKKTGPRDAGFLVAEGSRQRCLAAGLALVPGFKITGLGPPKNWRARFALNKICGQMALSMLP